MTPQQRGHLPQYYPQLQPQGSGFQQSQATPFASRASGSQGGHHQRGGASSSSGHRGKGRGRTGNERTQSQAYAVIEARAENTIVDGMILSSHSWAHVLFDTGATHSFISMSFASSLQLEMNLPTSPLLLTTPMGRVGKVSMICMSCCVVIKNPKLFTNLFVIPIGGLMSS